MSTHNVVRGFTSVETSRPYIAGSQVHGKGGLSSSYYVSQSHQDIEGACVNRYDIPCDSSRSRFLQWMIYCRNTSIETKEVERKSCPSLWCRTVFSNEQELIDHVRSCPDLSKGEYWCSICSQPEQYLSRHYRESPLDQSSQEELRSSLITKAKETISMLGIGSVVDLPRRTTPLSTLYHSHSKIRKMGGNFMHGFSSTSELHKIRSFPTLFELPTHAPPSVEVAIRSNPHFQIPTTWSCEQFQNPYQFSRVCVSRRSMNERRYSSQIPSPIPLNADCTSNGNPLSSSSCRANSLIFSQSKLRQQSIPEELILATSPINYSAGAHQELASSFGDRHSDKPGWRSLSGVLGSLDLSGLVQLFCDVLQEHVAISRRKIAHLAEIPSLRHLISMSPKTVAKEGFRTLGLMLERKEPTTLPELYALTHIAYTSIAIFGGDTNNNLKQMFVSLFQLGAVLESSLEKVFKKIATAVWSVPIEADSSIDPSIILQSLHLEPLLPTNSLVQACTRFLDLVERNSPQNLYAPTSLAQSLETTAFQNEEFYTVVKLDVTVPLMSTSSLECFIKDVASVEKRLEGGHITTIRQLELELIWACKMSSQSKTLYDRFLRMLFESCNAAHNRLFQRALSHTDFHLQDVNIVLEMMASIEETQDVSVEFPSKPRNIPVATSIVGFASPARASSGYDSFSSPSFTFSPTASSTTISNTSSFSSAHSATNQGTRSLSSPNTKTLKCPICGYEPDPCGIQKWKAGNLKRHMRSTHNGKRYECIFDGCGRTFIGRKDNLLSHQRDKGHLPSVPSFATCEDDFTVEDL